MVVRVYDLRRMSDKNLKRSFSFRSLACLNPVSAGPQYWIVHLKQCKYNVVCINQISLLGLYLTDSGIS